MRQIEEAAGEGEPQPYKPGLGDYGLPTRHARVALTKEGEAMKAEVIVPGEHSSHMLDMIIFVACGLGAILGPGFTFEKMPEGLPAWVMAGVAGGQLLVLLAVVVAAGITQPKRRKGRA